MSGASSPVVTVVGGGLAGCEAAWQLAQRGVHVRLIEMKPQRRTEAQVSNQLAELVCSNSFRSANVQNAIGLIKEEMRRLGSLVLAMGEEARVPAGDAFAVDRERFAAGMTHAIEQHPRIERVSQVVTSIPPAHQGDVIIATGPLTASELSEALAEASGQDRLYFYDSIAPIVSGDSIDRSVVFAASRYGKGSGDDYLNCPFTQAEYQAFLEALLAAETVPLHSFEEVKYFEGCLPIEVVAGRGADALRFGCMKPVGLTDPRTGQRPYAVVQLRQEDLDGQAFNLVGFQTKMKYPEQKRVFRMIPGLQQAEFLRMGAVHRNTYLDSPSLLDGRMRFKSHPHVRFAGQITGVEGYVESAAHGLVTGLLLASEYSAGQSGGAVVEPPPRDCALGALWGHVLGHHRLPGRPHEPQNINWSMFSPPPPGTPKRESKRARVLRAVQRLEAWAESQGITLAPPSFDASALPVPPKRGRRSKQRGASARLDP